MNENARDMALIEAMLSEFVNRILEASNPEERSNECVEFVDQCLMQISQSTGNVPIARKVLISGMATLCHNMFTFRDKLNGKSQDSD